MELANNSWEKVNWQAYKKRYGKAKPQEIPPQGQYEWLASRTGLPTVRVVAPTGKLIFLHSSIEPVAEARKMAAALSIQAGALVVVYGLGLGYLVEALLESTEQDVTFFVVEPDPGLFYLSMAKRDLRAVIESERVYLLPSDSLDVICKIFGFYYNAAKDAGICLTGLPGYWTVYPEIGQKLAGRIRDEVNAKLLNLTTMIKLGPDIMASTILNLVDYYTHPGVNLLFDRFTGVPAIIVSAGPSLNKNIQLLARAKGKAIIIAVGTAVKALQKQGIIPDFVVSIDPHPLNYEHFKNTDTSKTALLAELQSNRMILENYQGPVFVAGVSPLLNAFECIPANKGALESGGSVAHSAMVAAYKLGADPIILVGQDLAYGAGGHSHAAGTNYEGTVYQGGENLNYFKIKGNAGGQVLTDRAFYQFLRFFELWIRLKADRTYINATEGGAYIEGTKLQSLQSVLEQYCVQLIDVAAIIQETQNSFDTPPLEPMIDSLKQQLEHIRTTLSQAKEALTCLDKLEVACAKQEAKQMKRQLAIIKKIYKKFQADPYLRATAEVFDYRAVHQVGYRSYQAGETDDFHAAIADYRIYYETICEGINKIQGFMEKCLQQAEEETSNDEQSLRTV